MDEPPLGEYVGDRLHLGLGEGVVDWVHAAEEGDTLTGDLLDLELFLRMGPRTTLSQSMKLSPLCFKPASASEVARTITRYFLARRIFIGYT